MIKKILLNALMGFALLTAGCGNTSGDADTEKVVYVYNQGDYLDSATLEMFEKETGIHVVYDEFDTNESMYPKVSSGAVHYDVVCPSDYMIQKMIDKNLLQPLDFEQLPNAKEYIGQKFYEQSRFFDPENKYAVPYSWGTVGIMYNTKLIEEPIDSWSVLWDERYKDKILMLDSPRDALMVPLKLKGHSLNSTDETELNEARDMLIAQKPLVQAYVIDEAKDKLISGEAPIGVVYSGEALMISLANPDLTFVVPKEGTNFWIDGWVVTRDAENVENAHKFIDFMCRPEIALMNFDYLGYSTPNIAVRDLEKDDEIKNSPVAFPDLSVYENQETYKYLGDQMDQVFNDLWSQVKVK